MLPRTVTVGRAVIGLVAMLDRRAQDPREHGVRLRRSIHTIDFLAMLRRPRGRAGVCNSNKLKSRGRTCDD